MQNNYDQQDADLLTNIDVHLVRASTGKRFANYLIDLATFYLFIIAASFTLAFFNPEAIQNFGASRWRSIEQARQVLAEILFVTKPSRLR